VDHERHSIGPSSGRRGVHPRTVWQRVCMSRRHALVVVVSLVLASCSNDSGSTIPSTSADAAASVTSAVAAPTSTARADATLTEALRCDPLDEAACLLPWPNDAFTVPDDATPTGRRVAVFPTSTPANADGVNIDPTDINRADGFSPGSAAITYVPGLDIDRTGIATSTDIAASLDPNAPVVLLDTTNGERLPYWAELDAQATSDDQRLLMVHPAASLPEGHHVIVALRSMRDATGALLERSTAFQAALDGDPEPSERTGNLREMLDQLEQAGIPRDDLYVAWEFTVASTQSLSDRLLKIRNEAYADLGDHAPTVAVTELVDDGPVRTVEGTIDVPNYLSGDGSPGSTFLLDDDGLPTLNTDDPVYEARFRCVLPLAAAGPVPTIVYGHGLLNSRKEVDALGFAASAGLAAACATDFIGMSTDDIPNLAAILTDLSAFNQQADRMQQGQLNVQFLGRALNDPEGFAALREFQRADGSAIIDPGETQFVGNSQGGVLGGAASAISTEWQRVVLGVPGINYSLLLPRSTDWVRFQTIFDQAYTTPFDRVLALQLIQMLWDRGENDGYAQHLTADPYPGVTAKDVLLIEAFGDHQVANISTEILARTIGARVYEPALEPGRSSDVDPQWGLEPIVKDNAPGPALVVWDYGTPAPPTVNLPPTEPEYGQDPHGAGSKEPLVLQQAITFLLTGSVTDVCSGEPCRSNVLTG